MTPEVMQGLAYVFAWCLPSRKHLQQWHLGTLAKVVKPAARLCGEAGLDYAPTRLADSLFLNLLRKEPIEPGLVDCLQANLKPVDVLL
jgi:hypothetical protein